MPPVYPTAVATTPFTFRKYSSVPQKHPPLKAANSFPAAGDSLPVLEIVASSFPGFVPTVEPDFRAESARSAVTGPENVHPRLDESELSGREHTNPVRTQNAATQAIRAFIISI